MKVLITRQELVEVTKLDGLDEVEATSEDLPDFQDSFQDYILNSQGSSAQTDDDKFSWTPLELHGFTVEEVVDGDEETEPAVRPEESEQS